MKPRKACELCGEEASLHCEADSAFLCWECDRRVHSANFLVARHVRRIICPECDAVDDDRPVSGAGFLPIVSLCRSCDASDDGGDYSSFSNSSSCSSSCISTAESAASDPGRKGEIGINSVPVKIVYSSGSATESDGSDRIRRRRWRGELDARAEGVLVNWCRSIGLDGCAVEVASRALRVGLRKTMAAAVPFRVCVAAAVWFTAKLFPGGGGARRVLRCLEACSGVPAKIIVLAELPLSRAIRRCHVVDEAEGWAECS